MRLILESPQGKELLRQHLKASEASTQGHSAPPKLQKKAAVPDFLPMDVDVRRVVTWGKWLPHLHLRREIFSGIRDRYGTSLDGPGDAGRAPEHDMRRLMTLLKMLWPSMATLPEQYPAFAYERRLASVPYEKIDDMVMTS
eukprot:TRINITY_DN7852_c0_g1_i7.p2 TRINITY_DN7852_c0_g1~~TRINITY_DN7852_c0_g1_i7.p2  ORF type:complete len:141 (+),score=20.90 TRINITY_DN7852_c0_g1_i7:483-905(+)